MLIYLAACLVIAVLWLMQSKPELAAVLTIIAIVLLVIDEVFFNKK